MNSINIFRRFSTYFPSRHTVLTMCQSLSPYPVSALTPPTMPRLADAVRRWLCHPEPSSSSLKSTIKEKLLYDTYLSEFFSLVRKERKGQKEEGVPLLNGQFPTGEGWRKSLLSSARVLDSRPPTHYSGRAGNACTNLLGFFV